MIKFIKNIIFFSLGFIPLLTFGIFMFVKIVGVDNIPPVQVSNSVALNDKILFCNHHKLSENISIGSSMTLNNANSESIIKFLNSDDYLNLSSWGLRIEDVYVLFIEYAKVKIPKNVFIISSYKDFASKEINYNKEDFSNLLTTKNTYLYYLKYPEIQYYTTNVMYYSTLKRADTLYESLKYDNYGQVKYTLNGFSINEERWNHLVTDAKIEKLNYQYLDSIASFCKQHQINLYFIQSPIRVGLLNKVDQQKLDKHINSLIKIINKHNKVFINGSDTTWSDSLFVDSAHMNKEGARVFTDYFLAKIKEKLVAINSNLPPNYIKKD